MRLFVPIILFLAVLGLQASEPQGVSIISSEDYAVKRFQEVVAAYIENEPGDLQDQANELRTKLESVEKKFEQLESSQLIVNNGIDTPDKESVKPTTLRAAQAQIDHFRKRIDGIDAQILKQSRKQTKKSK